MVEFMGMFVFVFVGMGVIVVDEVFGVVIYVGVVMMFGLIVLVMIYLIGDFLGVYLNLVVFLGFCVVGKFLFMDFVFYVVV